MGMSTGSVIRVTESSQRGEARRLAVDAAERLGFGAERAGRIGIVVTELAGNLLKHVPNGGSLFFGSVLRGDRAAIDVVAVDAGPGLADERLAFEDGYSTAGSSGIGLGAVARMSDSFDVYSAPGKGTVIAARIWRDASAGTGSGNEDVAAGGVCGMLEGESVSGDDFAVIDVDGHTRLVVADGLGHGPGAQEAAAEAIDVFQDCPRDPIAEVLDSMHRRLRPTRGAAVAIADIDPIGRVLTYAGLGNIAGNIVTADGTKNLVSHNGTLGHTVRRIQEFAYELPPDSLVVMHSDGITGRWNLATYAGLSRRAPIVAAAVLYRDFRRGRDDATALVAKVT
jgi:anti-sigma regulatory factor (Ser/Thr protein kinase)